MPDAHSMLAEQDHLIEEAMKKDEPRLRNFIRRRVADGSDTEDILQEVFCELLEAYRLMKPIEQVSAWLFRVARNRITDRFRKKKFELFADTSMSKENEGLLMEELLPATEDGPEETFVRKVLLEEIEDALEELPAEQRTVFLAHEVEGLSFREISEQTGVSVNTLLSRKHYAVRSLRLRLQAMYREFDKR